MEAKIVLDISSIVWNEADFNVNKSSYYTLKAEVFLFIKAFEKCNNLKFLARKELLNIIMNLFPYKICNDHKMFDFQRIVLQFLASKRNISYTNVNNSNIFSTPNICYNYFSQDLQTEIGYLITEIHNSSDKHIFCTFKTRWKTNTDIQTNNGNSKTHHTIIHENSKLTIYDYYFNNIRNTFEHNPKHDSNKGVYSIGEEKVNPLSCYDERNADTTIPQKLLDEAKQDGSDFLNYDCENNVFVRFKNHRENKYHGYDEDINNVPLKIREVLLK